MLTLLEHDMEKSWDTRFYPSYTPKQMLEMGVFEGKYLNAIKKDFPSNWFTNAKLADKPDETLNFFGIKSRKSLSHWKEQGWINDKYDPLGWFQWYCNYFQGRRTPDDGRQIGRWISLVARHSGQVRKACKGTDNNCRPKQKQTLLQWAWKWNDDPKSTTIKNKNLKAILKEAKAPSRK